MPARAPLIVLAAAGYLLTPDGRARVSRAMAALRSAATAERPRSPRAIDPYTPAMVDRRHVAETPVAAQPGHGSTATEVAVEFYEENPPA